MYKTTARTNVANADYADAALEVGEHLARSIKGGRRSKIYKGLQVYYKSAGREATFGDVWIEATTPEAEVWLKENKNSV